MELEYRLRTRLFAAGLLFAGVGLAASAALAQAIDDRPATPEETRRITEALTAKGYTDIHDVEVDDGRFDVDARRPDGHEVDVELDLETLEIVFEEGVAASPAQAPGVDDRLTTPEETRRITEALTAKGYTDIHDVEVENGRFDVDALHPDGYEVDVELDPTTLEILSVERD